MSRPPAYGLYGSLTLLGCLVAIAAPDAGSVGETCNIVASPPGPLWPGASSNLSANCTGQPVAYAWSSSLASCYPATAAQTVCEFPSPGVAQINVSAFYGGGVGGCFAAYDTYAMVVSGGQPPFCTISANPGGNVQPGAWVELAAQCNFAPTQIHWASCFGACTPLDQMQTTCNFASPGRAVVAMNASYGGCLAAASYALGVSELAQPSCHVSVLPPGPLHVGSWATATVACTGDPSQITWSSSLGSCSPLTGPVTVCNFSVQGPGQVSASGYYPAIGGGCFATDYYPILIAGPGPSCAYTAVPADLSYVVASGGRVTVAVTASNGCPVAATSYQPWITVAGAQTDGSTTTIALDVAPNAGPVRATSIVLGGRLYLVTQQAGP